MKPTLCPPHTPQPDRPRRGRAAALLAALALALAACGGGGGGDSTSPEPGPGGGGARLTPYTLNTSAPPISVAVATDAGRAVSLDVPLEGGTIRATGADGSTYTLIVPGNALLEPVRITLTPVAEVSGLPVGETPRTRLGVQMEPSGLRFVNAATLVIEPAAGAAVPVERQLFVTWDGDGQKLAFAAPERTAQIRIQVLHFSGVAVVRSKGFDADVEAVRGRIGGDAERRIQSAVAERLARARQAQLLGAGDTEGTALDALISGELLEQWDREVVRPRIAAAAGSCAAARLAVQTILGTQRQQQLLGVEDVDYQAELNALIPVTAEVCMKEEFEICRDEHVLTRIIPARLGLERQAQLLGYPAGSFASTDRYVKGCLRFELDFFSTAGFDTEVWDSDEGVQALRVRLELDGPILEGGTIRGSTALQSMFFDVRSADNCLRPVEITRIGSTFSVDELVFTPSGEAVSDFRIEISPGLTGSSFRVRDVCSDPPVTGPAPLLLNHGTAYGPTRVVTADSPLQAWSVRDWTLQAGSAVLATKAERVSYQVDARTTMYYDDRWELRHTPQL
jgi:hypothetical protein